jgi:hypothetical protein
MDDGWKDPLAEFTSEAAALIREAGRLALIQESVAAIFDRELDQWEEDEPPGYVDWLRRFRDEVLAAMGTTTSVG